MEGLGSRFLKNIQTKGPAKNWKLEGFQRCLEEIKRDRWTRVFRDEEG
jgi:hypothetical protein